MSNNSISVSVETEYLTHQSDPDEDYFAFGYTITIYNAGDTPAKLLRRHWIITDADGNVQELRGEGVIGEQPLIQPGESYTYTSGAILPTPVASMQGSYTLCNTEGEDFDAIIPPFSLAMPELVH